MLDYLKKIYRFIHPRFQSLHLEYKTKLAPRYVDVPHDLLDQIIRKNQKEYSAWISKILLHKNVFEKWKVQNKSDKQSLQPTWDNGFFPALDMMALYTIVADKRPNKIIEIGSGNSTKVIAAAINENHIDTHLTSIDPKPRAYIDDISDSIIREPLENIDLNEIKNLSAGDILFIDNSHRILPNSDATVVFMDILPYLKPGVVVHIHDIYLPFDYPQFMCDRFYSEQYSLATMILSNFSRYHTIFPAYFIYKNPRLHDILKDVWTIPSLRHSEKHGGSYWIVIDQ